jgi:hypothetical protein
MGGERDLGRTAGRPCRTAAAAPGGVRLACREVNGRRGVRDTASWDGTRFFRLEVDFDRGLPKMADWRKGPLMHRATRRSSR